LFNGWKGLMYRASSAQTDIYPRETFRMHVSSLGDFVHLVRPTPQYEVETIGSELVLTAASDYADMEVCIDHQTGFARRSLMTTDRGSGRAIWQFKPQMYEGGLLLPSLYVEATV